MTTANYWTCPTCGESIPFDKGHNCRIPAQMWSMGWYNPSPADACPAILERIAKALEEIAHLEEQEEDSAASLVSAMQTLYANEINCGLQSFWDGGFEVWIGDKTNGYKAIQYFRPAELQSAGEWLIKETKRFYPNAHIL